MNKCEIHTGRLVEISVPDGYNSPADVDHMIADIVGQVKLVPEPTKVVIAADWRWCRMLGADAQVRAHTMLTAFNPRTERSAILCSDTSPTAVLQFLRLVRESNNEHRRLYTKKDEMITWLSQVLAPAEQTRLHLFLGD